LQDESKIRFLKNDNEKPQCINKRELTRGYMPPQNNMGN